MLTTEFEKRLKKLNPFIKIETDKTIDNPNGGAKLTGVFCAGVHLCSCPVPSVPEYDVKHESGAMNAQGWRTILGVVVKNGCVPKDKAEKVFKCGIPYMSVDYKAMDRIRSHIEEYKQKHPWEFYGSGYRFKL